MYLQARVERLLEDQTVSVINERKDIWRRLNRVETILNEVVAKLSLLSVDMKNVKSTEFTEKSDPKQYLSSSAAEYFRMKAELLELSKRISQVEDKSSYSNFINGNKPGCSPPVPDFVEDVLPRRPSVLTPKSAGGYRRKSSTSSTSTFLSTSEQKPSTSPSQISNATSSYRNELRRLTSYVQELWTRDQDKFSELIAVFQQFNSRLTRLETMMSNGELSMDETRENPADVLPDEFIKAVDPVIASSKRQATSSSLSSSSSPSPSLPPPTSSTSSTSSSSSPPSSKGTDMTSTNEKGDNIDSSSSTKIESNNTREIQLLIEKTHQTLEIVEKKKSSKKSKISNWILNFTEENGIPPSIKDKESIHSLYLEYQTVSSVSRRRFAYRHSSSHL